MVSDGQLFMNIIGAALQGVRLEDDSLPAQQLSRLAAAAVQHHLLPLFYEAVYSLPQAKETLAPYASAVRRQVMGQAMRTQGLLALLEQLEQEDLHPLVVKGFVCRSLYPSGDHRPSSDEDLLVGDGDFLRCCHALETLGYATTDPEDAYERTYRSQSGLCIELHRQLFDPDSPIYGSWNQYFDATRAETISGVATLVPTEHILYLLLHAFKHFLHSGFGIRQVCDIVLFARQYDSCIHWSQVEDILCRLHADRFAAAVFLLGQHYWGIPAPLCREVDPQPLLADLLQAGIYGGSELARKRSSNITLSAASGQKSSHWRSALFPPRSSLTGRFPYLKKRPWLLPFAWLCRILTYKNNRSSVRTLQIGKERLALLRLYGVIEE